MIVWFVSRHILYLQVCYSIYADIPRIITYGCYQGSTSNLQGPIPAPDTFSHLTMPFRDPEGIICWNDQIKWIFLGMLLALQAILLVWFGMICNVAWKVVNGKGAEDTRSDDEQSEEYEEIEDFPENTAAEMMQLKEHYIEMEPVEEEVGVEALHALSGARRMRKGESAATSGVTLNRKELLGRIGCDKGSS